MDKSSEPFGRRLKRDLREKPIRALTAVLAAGVLFIFGMIAASIMLLAAAVVGLFSGSYNRPSQSFQTLEPVCDEPRSSKRGEECE